MTDDNPLKRIVRVIVTFDKKINEKKTLAWLTCTGCTLWTIFVCVAHVAASGAVWHYCLGSAPSSWLSHDSQQHTYSQKCI